MRALVFETDETVTLRYQITEDGSAKDIAGMSFIFAAKQGHADTGYMIAPTAGTIDDAAEGRFSMTFTMPSGPFSGVYSIVMEDVGGKRAVLSSPGGDAIRVIESILD